MMKYLNCRETGTHTVDKNVMTFKGQCHGPTPYALSFVLNFCKIS